MGSHPSKAFAHYSPLESTSNVTTHGSCRRMLQANTSSDQGKSNALYEHQTSIIRALVAVGLRLSERSLQATPLAVRLYALQVSYKRAALQLSGIWCGCLFSSFHTCMRALELIREGGCSRIGRIVCGELQPSANVRSIRHARQARRRTNRAQPKCTLFQHCVLPPKRLLLEDFQQKSLQ